MNIDTDVAVIGAGLAGLTAARELRRAGVDV
ncbi:FAD-dependent monooxygenase, partial [Mycolicibacterium pulveris]